jgi:hypothetical protein
MSQIYKTSASTPLPPSAATLFTEETGTATPSGNNINFFTLVQAAGSTPLTTTGSSNTVTIVSQYSQAEASSTASAAGLASFNSAQFTVDANGYVSLSGSTIGLTITGNSGGALSPTANNWNIFGNGVSASGISSAGNILSSGLGSTLTISPTKAQFMTNYTTVNNAASPYTSIATDYYISCDPSAGTITLNIPNSPTIYRLFIIKDRTGHASANNISITTPGGSVTIDGQTTYKIASNYGSVYLLYNGTSYEVF